MERAIECCSSLSDVDEDDIPITSLHLKLTPKEFEASGWSARQLGFVQAVYNAQQLRYDPPEYDLMEDSMLRLQEYTGITNEEIQELLKADVVRHDTDHPTGCILCLRVVATLSVSSTARASIMGMGRVISMSPVSTCSRLKSSAST